MFKTLCCFILIMTPIRHKNSFSQETFLLTVQLFIYNFCASFLSPIAVYYGYEQCSSSNKSTPAQINCNIYELSEINRSKRDLFDLNKWSVYFQHVCIFEFRWMRLPTLLEAGDKWRAACTKSEGLVGLGKGQQHTV
jgi:hypothetical protein